MEFQNKSGCLIIFIHAVIVWEVEKVTT
jgi:hypothetical protein